MAACQAAKSGPALLRRPRGAKGAGTLVPEPDSVSANKYPSLIVPTPVKLTSGYSLCPTPKSRRMAGLGEDASRHQSVVV